MEESEVIRELVEKGRVSLVPAMYDVATGKVTSSNRMATSQWLTNIRRRIAL